MNKAIKKLISVMLSVLMVMTSMIVAVPTLIADAAGKTVGGNTQEHVVSNYSSANAGYKNSYLSGFAVPLDGTNGNPDMTIPGLNAKDDMVPQGLAYYPEKNWVLVTSYIGSNASHTNSTSVIYAMDFTTGEYVAKLNIYNADGSPFTGHAGGLGVSENNLYICDTGSRISYIPLSDLEDIQNGTEANVKLSGTCSIGNANNDTGTSYLSVDDGILWTGNFYQPNNDSYGKAANSSYNSIVLGYDIGRSDSSEEEWNTLVSMTDGGTETPSYVIVCPNGEIYDIQSLVVKDNKIYIGTSWGRTNDSKLYAGCVAINEKGTINLTLANGVKVNAHTITSIKSYTHLPMTEGLFCYRDSNGHHWIYNGFESAAYYYYGYNSSSISKNPTDVIWRIDADALYEDAFSDVITNEPIEADSGLSLEVVATKKNEPVTRVMRSKDGGIGTVYYAVLDKNGNAITNDSYYAQDYVLLKASNHSTGEITITNIKSPGENVYIGKNDSTTGSSQNMTAQTVIPAGETVYFKVTNSGGALTGAFTATYKMSNLTPKGSITGIYTQEAYMRIVGNVDGTSTYFNKNEDLDIIAMTGWNGKSTYTYPIIKTSLKYSSPTDIGRTIDSSTCYVNMPSSVTQSNIDSSGDTNLGFADSKKDRTSSIRYNINAAKYPTLLSAKIIWKIGSWKEAGEQYFINNTWTGGVGTVLTSDSKTQYPLINVNNDVFTKDYSNVTAFASGTKDTYLTGIDFTNNTGMFNVQNEIRVWNDASRGATRVKGTVNVTLNAYNASKLATLLHKCENTAFISERYNSTLWAAYQEALTNAANRVGAYAQTQSDIDEKYSALESAYNALLAQNASVYNAEIYKISHSLYKGRVVSGEADKVYNKYFIAAKGETFSDEYINDSVSTGYTLSFTNKIDGRDEIFPIKSTVTETGTQTVVCNYYAKEYEVTFYNDDGSVLQNEKFVYTSAPAYTSAVPEKEPDKTYHYVFSAWSPDLSVVTGPQNYTAQYNSIRHSFTTYVSDNNATCTQNATETAKCDYCAITDIREVAESMQQHKFTNYTSDGNATCMADGTKTAYCDNGCGAKETVTDVGSKLSHNFTVPQRDENDHWMKCEDCDTIDEKIPHSFTVLQSDGADHWYKCDGCDETTEKTPHTYGEVEYNWSDDGNTCAAIHVCTADGCEAFETETATVEAGSITSAQTKAPTCQSNGETTYTAAFKNTAFGTSQKTVADIDAVEHKYLNYTYNDDATCQKAGTKTGECQWCDETDTIDDTDHPILPHSFTGEVKNNGDETHSYKCANGCGQFGTNGAGLNGKENCEYNAESDKGSDATCTQKAVCSVCLGEYGDVLGHKWTVTYTWSDDHTKCIASKACANDDAHDTQVQGSVVSEVKKPASCTEDGKTSYTAAFDDEDCEEQTQDVTVPAFGHALTCYEAVEANCRNGGNTKYWLCSDCGEYFLDDEGKQPTTEDDIKLPIDPNKHASDETYLKGERVATCLETGYCGDVCYACCDALISEGTETQIDPNNHASDETYVIGRKTATCTETGYSGDTYYSCCDELKEEGHETNTVPHSYGEWTVIEKPDCRHRGLKTAECTVCEKEITQSVPKAKHTDNDGDGICEVCGESADPSDNCSCICHKTDKNALYKLIYNIFMAIWKLFGSSKVCACGATHY